MKLLWKKQNEEDFYKLTKNGVSVMADYRTVNCPDCGRKIPSNYRADLPSENKAHGYCPGCGEKYTVTYGNGRVSIKRG